MNVVHLLTAMTIAVNDQAVAVLIDAFGARDFGGDGEQAAQRLLVGGQRVVSGRD